MGQAILNGPTAHLGAVQLESMHAQGLRGREAVRTRRRASQTLSEQLGDRLGPGSAVIATRSARDPPLLFLSRASTKVFAGEHIKTAAREFKLFGRLLGRQNMFAEAIQYMPDERRGVPI